MKKLITEARSRVVFVPLYKSFGDFFIQQFVNYKHGIEPGFTFGSFEDTPKLGGIKSGWMAKSGYIYARRKAAAHSLQSSYINTELLKEIIENNSVTTLFQNKRRFRSGKLHRRQKSDLAIQWLINAAPHFAKLNLNVMIIPVMISYDRLYEQNDIARKMISGKRDEEYTFAGTIKKMYFTPENSLGEGYIKYLDSINLEDYLNEKLGADTLNHDNFETIAL